MYWLNFGKWMHKSKGRFIWERVYVDGYRWTPLVKSKRKPTRTLKKYPDGKVTEEVEKDHYCNGTNHLGDLGCH